MMAMMHARHGWLLYANPEIGGGTVLSGDVLQFELSAERSYGGTSLSVRCELPPGAVLRYGQVKGQEPKPLEAMMWDALQSWPENGKGGRRWPPEMLALLTLARNHPEEYERLRDGEAVLRALGG